MAPVLQRALQADRPGRLGLGALPRPGGGRQERARRGLARTRLSHVLPGAADHRDAVRARAPGVFQVGAASVRRSRTPGCVVPRTISAKRSQPSGRRGASSPCTGPSTAKSKPSCHRALELFTRVARGGRQDPCLARFGSCISSAAVKWMPSAPRVRRLHQHLAAVAVRAADRLLAERSARSSAPSSARAPAPASGRARALARACRASRAIPAPRGIGDRVLDRQRERGETGAFAGSIGATMAAPSALPGDRLVLARMRLALPRHAPGRSCRRTVPCG